MWLLVWALVLVLVHIQFNHCRTISITMLKLVEATAIVFLMQMWYQLESAPLGPLFTLWNDTWSALNTTFDEL